MRITGKKEQLPRQTQLRFYTAFISYTINEEIAKIDDIHVLISLDSFCPE